MKSKDLVIIGVVVIVSIIVSVVISNKLFSTPVNQQQQVQVVGSIDSSFPSPSPLYFNTNANDPSQSIPIGLTPNPPSPFNSTSN